MGHAGCQNQMGLMLLGKGKPDAAAVWLNLAVKQDQPSADAMFNLAMYLGQGQGHGQEGSTGDAARGTDDDDDFTRAVR